MLFSVLSEIDGMLWATRRGRVERDVCASSGQQAVCDIWGLERWQSCVSFCQWALFLRL